MESAWRIAEESKGFDCVHKLDFVNGNTRADRIDAFAVEFVKYLFKERNHLGGNVRLDGGVVKVVVVVAVIDDTNFTHRQFCLCIYLLKKADFFSVCFVFL